jgi:hypothetical protein
MDQHFGYPGLQINILQCPAYNQMNCCCGTVPGQYSPSQISSSARNDGVGADNGLPDKPGIFPEYIISFLAVPFIGV